MAKRSSRSTKTTKDMNNELMVTPKKLTIDEIESVDNQLNSFKEVLLGDGQYVIKVDTKFRNTKIQNLILDFQRVLDELRGRKVEEQILADVMFLYYILIIKHFTDLELPDNVDQLIHISKKMIDAGFFEEIINSFEEDQLMLVVDKMNRYTDNLPELQNTFGEILDGAIRNANLDETQ